MYAMQYEISLPADYDMTIIRRRVAAKGPLLDHFPGLGLKAYLIRENGVDGSPVNQYAPFYLWASSQGMGQFLWGGGGFNAIVASFGRPRVRHWTGVSCRIGPDRAKPAGFATRQVTLLRPDVDPADAVNAAVAVQTDVARMSGVFLTALAVDPLAWEIVHFTLWGTNPPDDHGERYEVLHLSTPQLDEILA